MIRRIPFEATVGAAALLGFALRLAAIPPMLPDLDAVNFAEALGRFDLREQAPHFPGYPVYVALTRLLRISGTSEPFVLAFPGALLASVSVVLVGLGVGRRWGQGAGTAAAVVLALAPLAVLQGGVPASDGMGFALLCAGAGLALLGTDRPALLGAGALLGLAVGARPGLAPAAVFLPWAFEREGRRHLLAGGAFGLVAWAIPLTVVAGASLWEVGPSFLEGHASRWGGTLLVDSSLAGRINLFGFDLLASGLGLAWPGFVSAPRLLLWGWISFGLAGLLLLVRGGRLRERLPLRIAAWSAGPYAAWILVGQNLAKARHALPLLVAAAIAAAALVHQLGISREGRRWAAGWTAGLAFLLFVVSLPLAREQGRDAPPAARLVAFARESLQPEGTMLFTGEEGRLFSRYAPEFRVGRPADPADLVRDAERLARAGVAVFVTSQAPGVDALWEKLHPVSRFRCDPLVRSYGNDLVLFRYLTASKDAS